MDTDPMTIERLRSNVAPILGPQPVYLAYVYGSVAAGCSTPLSDVDVALVVDDGLTPLLQLRLGVRLETEIAERSRVRNVQVRIINDAPLMLRGQVVLNGVLIYSRAEASRIAFETSTRDAHFDYQPTARRFRQSFLADLVERGLRGQSRKTGGHPEESEHVHRISAWARAIES